MAARRGRLTGVAAEGADEKVAEGADTAADREPDVTEAAGGMSYSERLSPPWGLWVAGWVFALALGVTCLVVLGPLGSALATLLSGGLVALLLVRASAQVTVAGGWLVAGRARIPVDLLGPARPLDAEAARRVRGPDSDPAAFHLIRGWVSEGVLMEVRDPADPTPYWFVATRRPERLAAAINAARSADGPGRPGAN